MADEYLFISDCHLDPARPEVAAELTRFLEQRAAGASRLYILGDLFEVWLGDDDPVASRQPVLDSLRQLARHTAVFFMAGNRDFLVGEKLAADIGMQLLQEPQQLRLGDHQVVLIHGDTLCTDDHDYQQFRALVRGLEWQAEFLGQPLEERQRIAAQLRSDSTEAMTQKEAAIMDTNPQAVLDCFQQNRVDTIIHGHTHRPNIHQYDNQLTRYVLGDWNPGPSYLSWTSQNGFQLVDSRV